MSNAFGLSTSLLRDFRRGESRALERVYCDHVNDVRRSVRRGLWRIGRFSEENLADLSQEVFLKAFARRARLTYDGVRDYRPFLAAIARNVLSDWAKNVRREQVDTSLVEAGLETESSQRDDLSPDLLARISCYVESLPPDLRAVHERRFVASEPQRRAAEMLGITRQTLRTREKKLLEGLRLSLEMAV